MFSVRTELDFYPTCHVKSVRQIIAVKLEVFLNKLSHGLAWSVVHIRSFVWYCHLCSIKGHVSEVGFASVIRNNENRSTTSGCLLVHRTDFISVCGDEDWPSPTEWFSYLLFIPHDKQKKSAEVCAVCSRNAFVTCYLAYYHVTVGSSNSF